MAPFNLKASMFINASIQNRRPDNARGLSRLLPGLRRRFDRNSTHFSDSTPESKRSEFTCSDPNATSGPTAKPWGD
jgi:hypothetical protein